jgi:hypothetical protein
MTSTSKSMIDLINAERGKSPMRQTGADRVRERMMMQSMFQRAKVREKPTPKKGPKT